MKTLLIHYDGSIFKELREEKYCDHIVRWEQVCVDAP